jgi:hypothetical protein
MHRRRKVHKRKENKEKRRIKPTEDKAREERKRIKHDIRMTTRHSINRRTTKESCIEKSNPNNQLAKGSMHCNGVFLG